MTDKRRQTNEDRQTKTDKQRQTSEDRQAKTDKRRQRQTMTDKTMTDKK